ncbi:unnamed protein product [Eruca vesicaria subsp. sativa]|uniref:Uncharacterized protein n=1 Tax=Eruca vesicaria subsp. sativa TaxID=29727 RepID=A0ABC8K7D3_ERUVS|nr:unnamed protein product [Eruca vesicaria subsp. sativa]
MKTHSAATRKNKEWQDKLPVVVLKAEEIMYSKTNSKEKYTDGDTMWNRVSDAIDTIIKDMIALKLAIFCILELKLLLTLEALLKIFKKPAT